MSKKSEMKNVIEDLRTSGYIRYGAEIPGDVFREVLGIEIPDAGDIHDFRSVIAKETFDYLSVKSILLTEGKCFVATQSNYRILAIHEHEAKARGYMDEARGKMTTAQKLMNVTEPVNHEEEIKKAELLSLIEFRKNSLDGRRCSSRPCR